VSRLACLFVPLYPLAARLRSEPELRGEPAAVIEGNGHAARIAAATRRARRAGIRRGMSLPQARGLMPKLIVRPRDPECERAARESLLEVAETFSPRIESERRGVTYLDLDGLARHFSGDSPERAMGQALMAATEAAGLPCWVGIASSKLAARVAAESAESPTIVEPGAEARFLAPLPLGRLSPETEVMDILRQWGIRSVGDFARLPKNQVASRLGPSGQKLHEKARGLDRHPIVPYLPSPTFHEGMELDWPLISLEPFLFIARAALDRLCQRLGARGLACTRLELSMRLEPDGHHERSIQLPAPTRDPKTLLTLARLDLERQPPGAPVIGFTLTAHPDRPRGAQLSLFGPTALSPDQLATTLARLFSLLGGDGVGSPRTVDGHRPERCALVDYLPPPAPDVRPEPPPTRGLLAARVIRPPVPLEVITSGNGGAPPAGANSTAAAVAEPETPYDSAEVRPLEIQTPPPGPNGSEPPKPVKRREIQGRVRVASGPWTLEDSWWTEDAAERSYWDVELSNGCIYRIYRDHASQDWFADGVYD
jgi:protein ImuB